jgi:NAD-dependent SIR2 family protein deacetylase
MQCRNTSTHYLTLLLTSQDFRSEDGLYNLVKTKYPQVVVKGRDLFDVSLFSSPDTASIYFTFIASLRQSILDAAPTPTHKFIRLLHERGKLLRCYTQNIDGIEARVGLAIGGKEAQICQLHGDIHTLRCHYCNTLQEYTVEWTEMLLDGFPPDCPECIKKCTFFSNYILTQANCEKPRAEELYLLVACCLILSYITTRFRILQQIGPQRSSQRISVKSPIYSSYSERRSKSTASKG